ncbi:MAG: hypothetical protein JWN52_4778 [Actinomycetia bacterium]|nr:hypothetical protein [Actinomycetes bacterium]
MMRWCSILRLFTALRRFAMLGRMTDAPPRTCMIEAIMQVREGGHRPRGRVYVGRWFVHSATTVALPVPVSQTVAPLASTKKFVSRTREVAGSMTSLA